MRAARLLPAFSSNALTLKGQISNVKMSVPKGFGSPTFFVNNKYMYFGNDRLPLLERRLQLESKL